jgi:hypothetical protein
MYSTTNDLTILGRSILTSTLIKPAITRRWLKLRAFVSNLLTAVGAPWEIRRFQAPPNNRIVDLYMKIGDLPGYSSLLVLNPDWDVCFSILSIGANPTTNTLLLADLIAETILPAIEIASREEANTLLAGSYVNSGKSLFQAHPMPRSHLACYLTYTFIHSSLISSLFSSTLFPSHKPSPPYLPHPESPPPISYTSSHTPHLSPSCLSNFG